MTNLLYNDLLTRADFAAFRDAFAAKTRWYLPGGRIAEAQALLPWATIEALIGNGLVTADRFRVVVNGNEVREPLYGDDKSRLRADAVQGFATQGATLAINDIGALVPAIGEWAITLERDLRCRVTVNCYITFGEISAFTPHHDGHDVLILQIHGAKRWRSFGVPTAFPLGGGHPSIDWDAEWEGMMAPGDLLYLPRGEVHAAIPESRPSVHLTIGISEVTGVDFLQWLAVKAKNVEALRRDLGATLVGDARAARDAAVISAVRDLLDDVALADFAADQDREQPLRPLVTLAGMQSGSTRFLADTELVSALRRRLDPAEAAERESVLTIGKRKLRLSHLAQQALAAITDAHRITVVRLAAVLGLEPDDPDLERCLEDLAGKSLIAIRHMTT